MYFLLETEMEPGFLEPSSRFLWITQMIQLFGTSKPELRQGSPK